MFPTRRNPRILRLALAWWLLALGIAAGAEDHRVAFRLDIVDSITGSALAVSIERKVERGIPALEAMEALVAVESKSFPGVGVFVRGLCGVTAPDGTFWQLSVNDERSERGIAEWRVDAPMHLRWELVQMR